MTKTIEEILAPKPVARPRIYAYAIDRPCMLPTGCSGRSSASLAAEPELWLAY